VAQEVGVGLGVEEVVDGDDLFFGVPLQEGLEGLPADPAEAVDPDSHHSSSKGARRVLIPHEACWHDSGRGPLGTG
jgi:hypothetical protein